MKNLTVQVCRIGLLAWLVAAWPAAAGPVACNDTLALDTGELSVGEGSEYVVLHARRTGTSCGHIGVSFDLISRGARAGMDYPDAWGGQLDWDEGQETDVEIYIPIFDDALDEGREDFLVVLSAPSGGATLATPAASTITIVDNDLRPTVAFARSISSRAEGEAQKVFVRLSVPSGRRITVPIGVGGTATPLEDYDVSGRGYDLAGKLTFPPGLTSRALSIAAHFDTAAESTESVVLQLGTPSNAELGTTAQHAARILNVELPAFALNDGPLGANETTEFGVHIDRDTPAFNDQATPPAVWYVVFELTHELDPCAPLPNGVSPADSGDGDCVDGDFGDEDEITAGEATAWAQSNFIVTTTPSGCVPAAGVEVAVEISPDLKRVVLAYQSAGAIATGMRFRMRSADVGCAYSGSITSLLTGEQLTPDLTADDIDEDADGSDNDEFPTFAPG